MGIFLQTINKNVRIWAIFIFLVDLKKQVNE